SFQHRQGSRGVGGMRGEGVLDASWHAAQRRKMDHGVHPDKRLSEGGFIEDAAFDEAKTQPVDVLSVAGREIVENGHLNIVLQGKLGKVRTDEAGSPRDEQAHESLPMTFYQCRPRHGTPPY